ncbi:hypothetical protein [Photobacterium sp. Hal280]|uniref:hypothetical protein n=1 Tax=Photobacterium sp. Hal280 TaxID=3035163 RepID=UPI00301CA141
MAVYLDSIRVAPRRDFLKFIDEYSLSSVSVDLTDAIRFKLVELLPLRSASDAAEIDTKDVSLVVRVPYHRRGTLFFGLGFLFGWRPLVTIEFDIISLSQEKQLETLRSTERLSWGNYIKGLLRFNSIFHLKPEFGFLDLKPLIEKSVLNLLVDIRAKYS